MEKTKFRGHPHLAHLDSRGSFADLRGANLAANQNYSGRLGALLLEGLLKQISQRERQRRASN